MNRKNKATGGLFRYFFGIGAIAFLCFSFSGFSYKNEKLSYIFSLLYTWGDPKISYINAASAGALAGDDLKNQLICDGLFSEKYIASLLEEGKDNVLAAGKEYDLGTIEARVGDKTYSIYDKILEENEEVNGDVCVIAADTENDELILKNDSSYNDAANNGALAGSTSDDNTSGNNASGYNTTADNSSDTGTSINASGENSSHNNNLDDLKKSEKKLAAKIRNGVDTRYLLEKLYIVDSTTSVKKSMFPVKKLLSEDMSLAKSPDGKDGKPQILVYHTHAVSEGFADGKTGKNHKIAEVGEELCKVLRKKGYSVLHDTSDYDMVNGKLDRSKAYAKALTNLKKILETNPSIQVIIDLHRDGIGSNDKALTNINGRKTARIMFFNGLSRNSKKEIKYLKNDNLFGNLSFSLKLKLKAMELYPGFAKPVYLKGYRYNLHLKKRSMLVELGNQNNTFEEALNATKPLADIIDGVLSEKN
ncbi:MAG: stage II sporulation protein P [Lachnospiraceae bacterium]|nr:stage II sporulation protein P [Lachnospiraceae bacterium]